MSYNKIEIEFTEIKKINYYIKKRNPQNNNDIKVWNLDKCERKYNEWVKLIINDIGKNNH